MHKLYYLIMGLFFLGACNQNPKLLDVQGHRGARGLIPENTIPGFIKAVELGVTTLEMDVVISGDGQVVVSHDPYFHPDFCLDSNGSEMNDSIAMQYVIYEMDYSTIQTFDCGSKIHPRFPQQQKMNATKPLLSNVIDEVEAYVKQNGLPAVQYNIETKLSPEGDGELHPKPDTFVTLLMQVVRDKGIAARTIVQSFDPRTLEIMHERHPDIRLALLVENDEGITYNLDRLTFLPDIYSPDFTLLDKEKVEELQQKGLKVIPWTVNEREDIQKVINTGVDGIISDYPDRVMEVVKDGKSVGA